MDLSRAISKINNNGVLLVFPVNNKKEPNSLWQELHPRKKMRWEWDENGDQGVADLWFMREQLSTSNKVVYTKWYQGRATFFSYELYIAILRLFKEEDFFRKSLPFAAREVLDVLSENSPLSTKQLKKATDLVGKDNESKYSKALKELFNRFLIVAYGEVDEGAFPSVAIGSSEIIFEDLWGAASELTLPNARKILDKEMPEGTLFRKQFEKNWLALKKSVERFEE